MLGDGVDFVLFPCEVELQSYSRNSAAMPDYRERNILHDFKALISVISVLGPGICLIPFWVQTSEIII